MAYVYFIPLIGYTQVTKNICVGLVRHSYHDLKYRFWLDIEEFPSLLLLPYSIHTPLNLNQVSDIVKPHNFLMQVVTHT